MNNYRSLNHTKWECQYHVVFIPKYRRKTLYGGLRHYLGGAAAFGRAAGWRKGICWRITSTCWVDSAEILGCAHKGKSAIHIARLRAGPGTLLGTLLRLTVGQDERVVREYVQQQEREDRRLEQLRLEE